MARHGCRDKEKSSHGRRVSTVSSSIESLQGIIPTVSWQRSVALTRLCIPHHAHKPYYCSLQSHNPQFTVGKSPSRNVRAGFTSLANTYIIRRRIYTWRTIMIKNKFMALTLTVVLTAGMLTGCGSGDKAKDKDAYRQYGINCIENGSYDDAVDAFQKALDQSVGSVGAEELDICYYKAKAQYLSGDVDGAIDTYTAIIDYNKDSDAYYLRGCIYFAKNDSDKGMKDFKTALSENDDNYELYLGVYETLSKYGMNDQGKEYLDKALKLKAKTADDYMQRGRIYTMLGDYDSAIKSLQKAIDEKLVKANYYMGEAYQKKGDNDSSQKYFKKYLDSGEADSYELMNMGQAQMDNGNYDTAITYFQNALELESVPNKQQITKAMIIAYEYSGDFATAKSKMEEYMKDYPDDEDAAREYQFLETR